MDWEWKMYIRTLAFFALGAMLLALGGHELVVNPQPNWMARSAAVAGILFLGTAYWLIYRVELKNHRR